MSCGVHPLARQGRLADNPETVLDLAERAGLRSTPRLPQRRELLQLGVELALEVTLLQQVTLDLAAGRLRDPFDRDDLGHFEAGLLVDEARHLGGDRQELLHAAAMQDKHNQLLGLGVARPDAGSDDLAEIQPLRPLRNRFQVVRVVVLAVDEDDFLGTPGDVQVALEHQPEVARLEPLVRRERCGVGFRVFVITLCDVGPADVDVTDPAFRQRLIIICGDPYAAVRDRLALADQLDRVLVGVR